MARELTWQEGNETITRNWVSESQLSPPKKILIADDTTKADDYYTQASQGAGFIYRGDFHNAKQLLQAVQRRIDKQNERKGRKASTPVPTADTFHQHRQTQAHKAQMLSRLLIEVSDDHTISLSRAPDVSAAIAQASAPAGAFVISLRELLGYIGAFEWRKKGVFIPALDANIHPWYGLFSPVRGEYLNLVSQAPIVQNMKTAFDIGTGTGVIAAILAKRGIKKITGTDLDPRAIECARENISRLGFAGQVTIECTDMFPAGTADLIVCNPPWLPARPTSAIERALYDEKNQMLAAFLKGVRERLSDGGEAWLILSDLAERLGLRDNNQVATWITDNHLAVIEVLETRPQHEKSMDTTDLLFNARSKEITKLWRLKKSE